jgi:hypothetical protein
MKELSDSENFGTDEDPSTGKIEKESASTWSRAATRETRPLEVVMKLPRLPLVVRLILY